MSQVLDFIRRFRGQRVLVLGDAILDIYLEGTATRLSAEGPAPVVYGQRREYVPGGAANTAVNVRTLGAQVAFLSAVGSDEAAALLRKGLINHDVSTEFLVEDERRTTMSKMRVYADRQFLVRFDEGDTKELDKAAEGLLLERLRSLFAKSDAVIVSDYLHGVVTPKVISELRKLNQQQQKPVVVDSKNLKQYRFCNVSVITPNHLEAQKALDLKIQGDFLDQCEQAESIGRQLLESINSRWVFVTLGSAGALLFEKDKPTVKIEARQVKNPHVIGAGDTFTSALTLALGVGADIRTAAQIANEAAAIAVEKRGTASVSQQELLQRMSLTSQQTLEPDELAAILRAHQSEGRQIVFTNGRFDGLHSGHIRFLRQAKQLGDILVVGVNSDRSVRQIRGSRVPFYPQDERLAIVNALDSVDYAVLFDENTPEALIRIIRPDVHVKGGDYEATDLPEKDAVREVGGRVVILPLEEKSIGPTLETGSEHPNYSFG